MILSNIRIGAVLLEKKMTQKHNNIKAETHKKTENLLIYNQGGSRRHEHII